MRAHEQVNTHLEDFKSTTRIGTRLRVCSLLENFGSCTVSQADFFLFQYSCSHGSIRLFHLHSDFFAHDLFVAIHTSDIFDFDVNVCPLHVTHFICRIVMTICHKHVLTHISIKFKHSSIKCPVMELPKGTTIVLWFRINVWKFFPLPISAAFSGAV